MWIQAKMGVYYEQVQEGFFYYNGFYYDGFYYDQPQGFYYDQQDAGFNQGNVDYWKKGDGRKVMLKALNSLRTEVDDFVLKNPSQPNNTEGRALSNVITHRSS